MDTLQVRVCAISTCLLLLFCPVLSIAEATAKGAEAPSANLDLSSSLRTPSTGHHLRFQQATIQVGSTTRTVTKSDSLTPAELVALLQVLKTGHQSIILGELGKAIGGTI